MEISQMIDEIKSDVECEICLEKFIKLTHEQFDIFYKNNETILPQTFEEDNCSSCYEDRFECITCRNKICRKCYWSFKNHKYRPDNDYIEDYDNFTELYAAGLVEGCPGVDCPITCPFCRTKDFKIYYGNKMPYELLNEIKDKR
jgi:hypothetical protein